MTIATQSERITGTVKWYHRKKGFGFITPDADQEDVFLHHSALARTHQSTIGEGDRVAFGVEQRKKGPSALDVRPISTPTPAQPEATGNFAALGLSDAVQRAIDEAGYTQPTPIQAATIPHGLAGRDVLGCAQTGTGKTASFALPTIQRLTQHPSPHRVIRALVVAPTRELAIQIENDFRTYNAYTQLLSTAVYGGVSQRPQVKTLRKGVDILAATPGRLLDLMNQGHIDLSHVEVLILDEADRMLDMGFLPDIRRITKAVPSERQTLLFSATLPDSMRGIFMKMLTNPVEVTIAPDQPTVEAIQQHVYHVSRKKKQALLEHLLADEGRSRVLVFTRTKRGANRVVKNLGRAGIQAEPIHGNKSQGARQRALRNFRTGQTRVLVATDVASRGIDVDDITHVIQFDLPNEPETYVHRIGRTGRAGAGGTAIAFCAGKEHTYLRDIERLTGQRVPVVSQHPFASG